MIIDSNVFVEVLRGNSATIGWLRAERAVGEVPLRYSPVSRPDSRTAGRSAIAPTTGRFSQRGS